MRKNNDKEQLLFSIGEEIKVNEFTSPRTTLGQLQPIIQDCKCRLLITSFFVLIAFFALCFRIFEVCLTDKYLNPAYLQKADNSIKYNSVKRADITDRNGIMIATSLPTVNLVADPKFIIEPEKTAQKLADILPNENYKTLYKKLTKKSRFVYIKRNISPNQQYQINYIGNPGLTYEKGERRVYPQNNLFSHILGMTNLDNIGISGLEKQLNKELTKSSNSIELSLDTRIQDSIRIILSDAIKEFSALGANAILMNINTGEIISTVSLPDYDPNTPYNAKLANHYFNRNTSGVYEIGSVFKVFNTALALDSGKIRVSDSFDASKPLKLKRHTIKDYRGENRPLTVPEILVYSSNIGSAKMAMKVGADAQKDFMETLGFFEKVPFNIPELGSPLTPRTWRESTTATISYGYGLAVTPLHAITAFSAMVNGGLYHKPTIVKQKENIGFRVVKEKTSTMMRDLLRLVITDGSGKKANIAGYDVGGKTGTAEKLTNGRYVDRKVRTTFVSAFPIYAPKYALLVMMDEPKGTKETWNFNTSGWNAVPTGGKIIQTIAPLLNLQPQRKFENIDHNKLIQASY